jgi:hypothetical protein
MKQHLHNVAAGLANAHRRHHYGGTEGQISHANYELLRATADFVGRHLSNDEIIRILAKTDDFCQAVKIADEAL